MADLIFVGDNIITMDVSHADAAVEAVAVVGDRIAAVGSIEEVMQIRGAATRLIELGDNALLPGFIDAHGHFGGVVRNADLLDLSSPPVGVVKSIDDIVVRLQERIAQDAVASGEWVFGYGYDDSLLLENRHPTRDDLDRASTQHPIVLRHVSGHLLAANSAALAAVALNSTTPDPAGGVIRRRPDSSEPNGVMEETAMRLFPSAQIEPDRMQQLIREAIDIYAGHGITTAQDGGVGFAYMDMMRLEAEREPFAIDLVAYVAANTLSDEALGTIEPESNYNNGFRLGGVKFVLDGSPQGRTAWLSQPYTEGPPGVDKEYRAYPSYDPEAYKSRMVGLLARRVPVLAHANGDAAIDLMIDGVAAALAVSDRPDHRAVTIHAQLMRSDQLQRVKQLGIVPSYYAAHPFFWGDWHRLSFGEDRAAFISPLKATLENDIPFTVHNDSPVVPPDMLRLLWVSVNRQTRSGYVLGSDQRLTVMEALHAMTLGAAYQYFEEHEKGSITVGKRADLLVLDANPLTVDVDELKDMEVVTTIARGETVFSDGSL